MPEAGFGGGIQPSEGLGQLTEELGQRIHFICSGCVGAGA